LNVGVTTVVGGTILGEKRKETSLPSRSQAQAFAVGIRRLELAVARERWQLNSVADADKVYALPEYGDLLEKAYADGFVHGDLSADGFDFQAINAGPREQLAGMAMTEVRRFVHALYRCERHNWGWGSLVLAAIHSGALGTVATRLEAGQ
jgi:hypothetical protein